MGPTKPKSRASEDEVKPPWQLLIKERVLDEETWKVKVFIIDTAENVIDRLYLNMFETFSSQEKRFVIKNISKTETIFMVNQLGAEKKVKDDNLLVFEEAERYLKEKSEIPSEILALIIKHLILEMKDEYQKGLRRESNVILKKEEVRGTNNVKRQESRLAQPTKNAPIVEMGDSAKPVDGKKSNGEEWRDKNYVDDYPIDGPNLYVAVSGFLNPTLAGCLIKIGVPVSAICKISTTPSVTQVPSTLNRAPKREHSEIDLYLDRTLQYWTDLQQIRLHTDTSDTYKNTAFIIFSPPYWSADQLSGNQEQIYDEVCYLMYDVQDLTRQHTHYLQNIEIINIPEDIVSTSLYKKYQLMMANLPLECVTIFSLLNSLLESICSEKDAHQYEYESNSSETVPRYSTEDVKVSKAKTLVRHIFNTLCKTDCDKTYRVTYGDEYENQKDPIIINYGDFTKYKTFHLANVNLSQMVMSSLYCMPINKLWQDKNLPNEELSAKLEFHYNVLVSCFDKEDVDCAEVGRLLQILACRKIYNNRSSHQKEHLPDITINDFKKSYLKRTKLAEPVPVFKSFATSSSPIPSPTIVQSEGVVSNTTDSDSEINRIKDLFECPDLSELVSAAEISTQAANQSGHIIDNYEFFEDFSGVSAFQIVHDAYNSYNCVNYKYCEVTDSFILMFFNSHDNEGIMRHEWRSHLVTPVCLHDFFAFVLEEEYKWIQNEEAVYDENMMLMSVSLVEDSMEVIHKPCIENTDIAIELLMEGSLKHQDLLPKNIDIQSPNDASTTTTSEKVEKTFTANESYKTNIKKSPKNHEGQKAFLIKENELKEESLDALIQAPKPFVGLDISDRRVEVFGKDCTFFSKDGTKVNTSYIFLIPSNLEYVCLNVALGITKTEFWFYKALGEYASIESLELCESFRICTKDQININIKKQEFMVPVTIEPQTPTPKSKVPSQLTEESAEILYEKQSFYSFVQTWPNGLITESVYVNNSDQISHVKQYHTQKIPNLEEESRCISLNGEVIIFNTNQEIEVLRPDGTHILITKVERKKVKTDKDSLLSQSNNSPKSGSIPKLSKNVLDDDEKEDPLAQYELFIKEFEIIETNGERQTWINDTSINIEKLIIRTATDYCIGEVFTRRMDGTNTLLNKDGLFVVTFPNNTRIITSYVIEEQEVFPEWTDEEIDYFHLFDLEAVKAESIGVISQKSGGTTTSAISGNNYGEETESENDKDGYVSIQLIYTIEHVNFASVTINKSEDKITVDSINHVSLTVSTDNQYNISLDNATTAIFDGNNLNINYEACAVCGNRTVCDISIPNQEDSSSERELGTSPRKWLKLKDSYDKEIYVNEEGTICMDENSSSQEIFQENIVPVTRDDDHEKQEEKKEETESSAASHDKCRNIYQNKSMRFLVLRRDLTCSELVHSALVEEYKHKCRWQPWCSINEHDTFGDHRKCHSIILPLNLNETEKWLLDSKFSNKPKYLTFKDLKKDDGKGFYHWMRPCARFTPQPKKPLNVLPPRQPRAFVLRTLEKQWDEGKRNEFCGAKAMITAILRYRRMLEADSEMLMTVPICEFRTEEEETVDKCLYEINNRIVMEDLKKRLQDDLTASVKPSITTEPLPAQEQEFFEEATEEELNAKEISNGEERSSFWKELNEVIEASPTLQKYWKRRADEYEEEQLYRHLLRDGSVPPYFQNVLGGAIWWESNNITTMAAMQSEQPKMICPCTSEEEASSIIQSKQLRKHSECS